MRKGAWTVDFFFCKGSMDRQGDSSRGQGVVLQMAQSRRLVERNENRADTIARRFPGHSKASGTYWRDEAEANSNRKMRADSELRRQRGRHQRHHRTRAAADSGKGNDHDFASPLSDRPHGQSPLASVPDTYSLHTKVFRMHRYGRT